MSEIEIDCLTEARIARALGRLDFFCGVTSALDRRARLYEHIRRERLTDVPWNDAFTETWGDLYRRLFVVVERVVEPEIERPKAGQTELF